MPLMFDFEFGFFFFFFFGGGGGGVDIWNIFSTEIVTYPRGHHFRLYCKFGNFREDFIIAKLRGCGVSRK